MTDEVFIKDIFSKWFSFFGVDPDKGFESFSGNSCEYAMWNLLKILTKLVKDYNATTIAFVTLRAGVLAYFEGTSFTALDVVQGKTQDWIDIYRVLFEDSRCNEIEDEFLTIISRFIAKPNLIGNLDRSSVLSIVPSVIEETDRLHEHIFISSGKPLEMVEVHNQIRVFNSMSLCLAMIENTSDGLYLCYINPKDSIDGYFSFIYKSNGNIISIDDIVNEEYLGQHRVQRRRNANYTRDKAFDLFPYDYMFDMSGDDGKGNFTDYKLKGDFSLTDLDDEILFALALAMILVIRKYCGKIFNKDVVVYPSYLIGSGAQNLIDSKSLIIVKDGILDKCKNIKVTLTEKEIFDAPACCDDRNGFYNCHLESVKVLNTLYCNENFIKKHPLVPDYSFIPSDLKYNEMLLSPQQIHDNAWYIKRKEITDDLQKDILRYYAEHDFGNEGVSKYREIVQGKKELILNKLKSSLFDYPEKKGTVVGTISSREIKMNHYIFYPFNDLSNVKPHGQGWQKDLVLYDEGGICRYCFTFHPETWLEAAEFLEVDESIFPKELRGWTKRENSVCGNSILEMTDQMEGLNNAYVLMPDITASYYYNPGNSLQDKYGFINDMLYKKYNKKISWYWDVIKYNYRNPFEFSYSLSTRMFKKFFPGAELPVFKKED